MNKAFYDFVMNKIDAISLNDLEEDLLKFGFDCERKVELWNTAELDFSVAMQRKEVLLTHDMLNAALASYAANDNSYALAA